MISAYERDRREPTYSTLDRLLRATGHVLTVEPLTPENTGAEDQRSTSATLREVRRRRRRIITLLERGGAHNPRIFGSVARGTDRPGESDVDVMVDLDPEVGLVGLIGLERQLSELLGRPVDLVPADSIKPGLRERAEAESIPL